MHRVKLSDRYLKSLQPAPKGKRVDAAMDTNETKLGVRVDDKGRVAFVYVDRFPGSKNPTRRTLGVYDDMSLAEARDMAETWRKLIAKDIDPAVQGAEDRAKEQARRENTFGKVVTDYIELVAVGWDPDDKEAAAAAAKANRRPEHRTGLREARLLRNEFVKAKGARPGLGERPITEITRADITRVLNDAKRRGALYVGHNLLQVVRQVFNWAIESGDYGLEASPCDRLDAAKAIGKKKPRKRTLNNDEMFAYWRAAGRLPYPWGPLAKMIALTGQRRTEVGSMRRREIDLADTVWRIPAEVMKMDSPHNVHLTAEAVSILRDVPNSKRGDYIFSTTAGEKPVNGWGKFKDRLDARMLRTLKALARRRGEDPGHVELQHWVFHDVRRTMRTALSKLKVPFEVAELVIAHAKSGMAGVYDQHEFEDEKREALEAWAAHLRDIVTPPPHNVIRFKKQPKT
jgi:integrase